MAMHGITWAPFTSWKYNCSINNPFPSSVHSKCSRATLLSSLSLLVAPVERSSSSMVSADIIKVLDLVDTDDPVLTGVGLLKRVEDWAGIREPNTSDAVHGLPRREKRRVVVVGHLVPVVRISYAQPQTHHTY